MTGNEAFEELRKILEEKLCSIAASMSWMIQEEIVDEETCELVRRQAVELTEAFNVFAVWNGWPTAIVPNGIPDGWVSQTSELVTEDMPNEVEIDGGVISWESNGTIRFTDTENGISSIWRPGEEEYSGYKEDYFPNHVIPDTPGDMGGFNTWGPEFR